MLTHASGSLALAQESSLQSGKKTFYVPKVALTSISYRESGADSYSAIAVTGSLGLLKPLSPRWAVAGKIYYTLANLKKKVGAPDARFFGMNAHIDWVPKLRNTKRFAIGIGLAHSAMTVAGNEFGFKDMLGPQLAMSYQAKISGKKSVAGHAKYALAFRNSKIASGTSELGLDAAIVWHKNRGHIISISLDGTRHALVIDGVRITSQAISLGFGFGL